MASSSAGFLGHTFAHINTIVALTEYLSASTHDIASRRLAAAHKFLSDEEHSTCKDWFECFLRTKSILLGNDETEAHNYFNGVCALHVRFTWLPSCICVIGWWSGHIIVPVPHSTSWASSMIHLWNGNILARKVVSPCLPSIISPFIPPPTTTTTHTLPPFPCV